jgi:hypothetical protein
MPHEDTPEKKAFRDARRCQVVRGPSGKFCELDLDDTGEVVIVREFDPVVMAEVNDQTGAILALTRLEFSDAFHRQGLTDGCHECHAGCHDVNLTVELEKPAFANMALHDIIDNYKYDASTNTLVDKMVQNVRL